MKMHLLACLTLMLALMLCSAAAETVSFCGMEIDTLAEAIDLGGQTDVDAAELAALMDRMPNLTRVDMYACTLPREAMDALFDGYPQVFFGWTLHIGAHTLRTDATSFSTLHGRCPEHSDEEFAVLRYCKNLVALDLGHNRVKDVSFLRAFPHMKVLILACNQIEDISVLAELRELEYLELFSNRIRDFTPLMELDSLLDLNISNNPVSDLSWVYGLDSLERFWSAMNSKALRPFYREMAAERPDCEIFWDGEPTWGGWRKHPRYDTIYAIFNEGGYRPFDE